MVRDRGSLKSKRNRVCGGGIRDMWRKEKGRVLLSRVWGERYVNKGS